MTCNECFGTSPPLFLTDCKHVFCRRCLQDQEDPHLCRVCGAEGIKFVEMGEKAPEEVQELFMPLVELAKRVHASSSFQIEQLTINLENLEEENRKLLDEGQKSRRDLEKAGEKIKNLKAENEDLKAEVNRMRSEKKKKSPLPAPARPRSDPIMMVPPSTSPIPNAAGRRNNLFISPTPESETEMSFMKGSGDRQPPKNPSSGYMNWSKLFR